MKPRVQVLTLAVGDLEQSVIFYRDGLGWPTDGIVSAEPGPGQVAFFSLAHGLVLALVPGDVLARDAKMPTADTAHGSARFSLGYAAASRDEVDQAMLQAVNAGATVIDPAQERDWGGYSGYFTDLDGHLWDVVWNPEFDE